MPSYAATCARPPDARWSSSAVSRLRSALQVGHPVSRTVLEGRQFCDVLVVARAKEQVELARRRRGQLAVAGIPGLDVSFAGARLDVLR